MKLASLRNGTRDGRLVVVSHDLTRCVDASPFASTLQRALDDWTRTASHLAALAESLEHGSVPTERFHEHDALSPLPRAYGRLAVTPPSARLAGSLRHLASDWSDAPRAALAAPDNGDELSVEAGLVAILGDLPAGVGPGEAVDAVRLVMLVADASRAPASARALAVEPGSPLASAFSPVAVTPDELPGAGKGADLSLALAVNGEVAARAEASAQFAALAAAAAADRALAAGCLVGAESWAGAARALVKPGETFRIEAKDARNRTVFGAIERAVEGRGG